MFRATQITKYTYVFLFDETREEGHNCAVEQGEDEQEDVIDGKFTASTRGADQNAERDKHDCETDDANQHGVFCYFVENHLFGTLVLRYQCDHSKTEEQLHHEDRVNFSVKVRFVYIVYKVSNLLKQQVSAIV